MGGLHKIYPLIELNWFNYQAGNNLPFDFEGRDLINFGAQAVSGHNSLSMAIGARYKFNDHIHAGLAAEFPLTGEDLLRFRLTADIIFRY